MFESIAIVAGQISAGLVVFIALLSASAIALGWHHRCVMAAAELERRRITLWLRRESEHARAAAAEMFADGEVLAARLEREDAASMDSCAWAIDELAHHAEVDK